MVCRPYYVDYWGSCMSSFSKKVEKKYKQAPLQQIIDTSIMSSNRPTVNSDTIIFAKADSNNLPFYGALCSYFNTLIL